MLTINTLTAGFFYFSFIFWPCYVACGVLVLWSGVEPGPLTMKAQSPNHWTAREVPQDSWLCACMLSPFSCVWLFLTLWTVARTGVGCCALLQGILRTQGSNPSLLHCKWILCCWGTGEALLITQRNKWVPEEEAGAFQVTLVVKNLPANAGDKRDSSSIPGLGKSPGEGHGNSL